MKRKPGKIGLCLISLLLLLTGIFPISDVKAGSSIEVRLSKYNFRIYDVEPGKVYSDSLTFYNDNDVDVYYYIAAANAWTAKNGGVAITTTSHDDMFPLISSITDERAALRDYIEVTDEMITVPANGNVVVPVTITAPEGFERGRIMGGLKIKQYDPTEPEQTGPINMESAVGLPISLFYGDGVETPDFSFVPSYINFTLSGDILSVGLKNDSTSYTYVENFRYRVEDMNGNEVFAGDPGSFYMTPYALIYYPVWWKGPRDVIADYKVFIEATVNGQLIKDEHVVTYDHEKYYSKVPFTTPILSSDVSDDGWYNEDVQVGFNAVDPNYEIFKTYYWLTGESTYRTYKEPFTVNQEGIQTVRYKSANVVGYSPNSWSSLQLKVDKTKPSTDIILHGDSGNQNNWYNSDITFNLNGTDALSGVKSTQYRINGGEWKDYSSDVLLSEEGEYAIDYRSKDKANNIEDYKTSVVFIDKTAPMLELSVDKDILRVPNKKFEEINVSTTTNDNFGVDYINLLSIKSSESELLSDESYVKDALINTEDKSFSLLADRDPRGEGRLYTITYEVEDFAGNKSRAETYVRVPKHPGPKNH
ncbi:OmpL47-type beta-barrel domain-containing protein [Rossellomorea sp. NPDC077527]|uniref:OmpL47-type beta-barrel domain-containing protein n=1 Tax=Rossellomorea sp. NPDC077527 TaxID=3364510 RepID=UPI0037C96C35